MRSLVYNKRGYRRLKPGYPLFVYLSRSLDSYLGADGVFTAPAVSACARFVPSLRSMIL